MAQSIKPHELGDHASRQSCWLAVHGVVWDVTSFLDSHPGGATLILGQGGKDATSAYEDFHDPGLIEETLGSEAKKGVLLAETSPVKVQDELRREDIDAIEQKKTPSLRAMVSLADFEKMAATFMSPTAWAYVISGADDEFTRDENARIYNQIYLRPRILRDVQTIDCSTTILGHKSSLPFYTSPVGLGKLVHPEGECAIAKGVGYEGVIQVVNTVSSMPIEQIMEARVGPAQTIFWQLYADRDLEKSAAFVRRVQKAGVKAIWLTVDSPVVGKRERDERTAAEGIAAEPMEDVVDVVKEHGVAAANTGFINPGIDWSMIEWLRSITELPIVVKGIQCYEDAIIAFDHKVDGIVLSNHGGRSQDTAQPPLLTLLEINKYAPHILVKHMQIFVDGGVRRGTDIVKALALGATAVGIGRPTLFSMAGGFGSFGIRRMVQILRRELQINMALLGARSVHELERSMLNTRRLEHMLTQTCKL